MDPDQPKKMKCDCEKKCFSTLNHILAFCYSDTRVIRWLFKQPLHGFQGVRGVAEEQNKQNSQSGPVGPS
jgi:hypothetical protein